MADDPDALSFRISNESLTKAIEILRGLGGFEHHSEAYQALVLERSRRELQSPPQEIGLARQVFQALHATFSSN
jgi:hypothetical protein